MAPPVPCGAPGAPAPPQCGSRKRQAGTIVGVVSDRSELLPLWTKKFGRQQGQLFFGGRWPRGKTHFGGLEVLACPSKARSLFRNPRWER